MKDPEMIDDHQEFLNQVLLNRITEAYTVISLMEMKGVNLDVVERLKKSVKAELDKLQTDGE